MSEQITYISDQVVGPTFKEHKGNDQAFKGDYITHQELRNKFIDHFPATVIWQAERPEDKKEHSADMSLAEYVQFFDEQWADEGLPRDWYNLKKKVGFSMNSQMNLLESTEPKAINSWLQRTEQDLKGFALEYLSQHLVYPCSYQKDISDPTRLVDPHYGNKDIEEVVSEKERNGSVKKTLKAIKQHFLSDKTPDGSVSIMVSPKGPSGLTTDDGSQITYPDSYFFILQKQGDTVMNYTVKTDFSLLECRDVIYRLTGKLLPVTAPIEDYVQAVAAIPPDNKNRHPVKQAVKVLENVRHGRGSSKAFGDITWDKVYKDIDQAKELYGFNQKANSLLEEFKAYCKESGRTEEELQKGLAATILRISKLLLYDEREKEVQRVIGYRHNIEDDIRKKYVLYGEVLNRVEAIPGCAGGGSSSSSGGSSLYMQSIVPRVAVVSVVEKHLDCTCPFCDRKVSAKISGGKITCPECGESAPYEC